MKVLLEGYVYQLENFESKKAPGQIIRFIHKEPAIKGSSKLVTIDDGTTNEDVLAMLISRMKYLHEKLPSKETATVMTHLEYALLFLNERTKDRQERGVVGTNTP